MSIRALIAKHGVFLATSTKNAGSVDAIGGRVESFNTSLAIEKAFVQISGGSDPTTGGRETRQRNARFYFDGIKSLDIEDRIVYAGATWEIRSVTTPGEKPTTSSLCHTIVEAEEVLG